MVINNSPFLPFASFSRCWRLTNCGPWPLVTSLSKSDYDTKQASSALLHLPIDRCWFLKLWCERLCENASHNSWIRSCAEMSGRLSSEPLGLPPAHWRLCVEVGVLCIHKTQNSNPPPSFSAIGNKISSWGAKKKKNQLLYWGGRHYKLSMRGLGAPWPLLQTRTQHVRLDYDH